jgi:hypothetical protein
MKRKEALFMEEEKPATPAKPLTLATSLSVLQLRMFLIGYAICLLFALVGVILGTINFAAGPVQYPGLVLALWLLANLAIFAAIALHLAYYGIQLWDESKDQGTMMMYIFLVVFPLLGVGITLLVNKHFGWFSASTLAALLLCGMIDLLMIRGGKIVLSTNTARQG